MLVATDINKTYCDAGQPLTVLKKISLKILPGDLLALVGPSGAGKSTLLHLLGGLDKPNQGKVFLDGDDLYQLCDLDRATIRNEKIGFVFQFYHLLPEFTIVENVVLPALIRRSFHEKKRLEDQAKMLLDKVGLGKRFSHKPSQLSGGEQQRAAIARALINDPKIILCDEPTGNLDSQSGRGVIDLLMKLNSQNNQAVVVATHDKNIADQAKKIIYIQDGEIIY